MKIARNSKIKTQGKKRSNQWPTLRRRHLSKFPTCALCGGNSKLEVHHIRPFHLHPNLELNSTNLITLCEGAHDVNCHLLFGHLGNFKSFNATVRVDATTWNGKIKKRPKS